MHSILLKQVKIWDPRSRFHNEKMDVLIKDGQIAAIEKSIHADAQDIHIFDSPSSWLSPGWIDTGAHIPDPGHEINEDFSTARAAGLHGGFTDVFVWPNTNPVRDQKTAINYVTSQNISQVLHFHPVGALSIENKGKLPAEMYDMHESGAIAYSDGISGAVNAGLLLRSLQYAQGINSIIIQNPLDNSWVENAMVHEGNSAILMGMKGQPDLVEWTVVARDLAVLGYTGGKLLFANLSAQHSLRLIKEAKEQKMNVYASVNPMNLIFDEKAMESFDPNFKVVPVLRTNADRESLVNALESGVIDFICSNHMPVCKEDKDREFALATYGVSMLETTFAAVNTFTNISLDRILNALSISPRLHFSLPDAVIEPGSPAIITLFNPEEEVVIQSKTFQSKSANSPFIGKTLKGKILGLIRENKSWFNS